MRTRRHALAALVAAVMACAAPAAALAQNAGDEQYADPFGKVQNKSKSGSGSQGKQGGQGTTGQGGSQGSSQSGTQSSAPTSSQTPATSAQQTLPRTGAPVGLFAATGAALLASGALLRRRVSLG